MAKLILKFDAQILREYGLENDVTIGRLPDNTIVVDNPAVSGHHARIVLDGDCHVIEDLESKNGTYVNAKHVIRQRLNDGDVVLVGKHRLIFDSAGTALPAPAQRGIPTPGETSYLDTRQHRALLARLRQARTAARPQDPGKADAARTKEKSGAVLRVLAGATARSEYTLERQISLIGRSDDALVRLHGWLKPRRAAAILRDNGGYAVAAMNATPVVNGECVNGRRDLRNGDLIEVAGMLFEFRNTEGVPDEPRCASS